VKQILKQVRLSHLKLRNSSLFGFRETGKKRLFFPGCSLPASAPEVVENAYRFLKANDPSIGMWSACCGRPMTQFHGKDSADSIHTDLVNQIQSQGIEEIILACGNCSHEFKAILKEFPHINITSLYDILSGMDISIECNEEWIVHHPCPARGNSDLQNGFYSLAENSGISVASQDKHPLPCCLIKSDSADQCRSHLSDKKVITYCAHCTTSFQKDFETKHILQLLFGDNNRIWSRESVPKQFLNYRTLLTLLKK